LQRRRCRPFRSVACGAGVGGGEAVQSVIQPQPRGSLGGATQADRPAQAEPGAVGQFGPVLLNGCEVGLRRHVGDPSVGVGGEKVAVVLVAAPPAALLRLQAQGAESDLIAVAQVACGRTR